MIKSQESDLSRAAAEAFDAVDPLAGFRDRFVIPDGVVYLDGNSLGCLPRASAERLRQTVEQWGARGVGGWEDGWLDLPLSVGDRLGGAVLGAGPGQVVIGDSTTVCFYKLASAALDLRPGRAEIVTDVDNFPTDRYVVEGLAAARGLSVRWLESADRACDAIGSDTALVTLSHVNYRTAEIAEMARVSAAARDAGALTLWDLSHSAGSIPVELDGAGADLAVGCTYKYLCGGPGAPAFMYVRRALQGELRQPIWGWLGRRDPFAMEQGYVAADGVRALLSGTPPVLALSAVDEGVSLIDEAGIGAIRAKGIALTTYAIGLADAALAPFGVSVVSPRDERRRGAHVALAHPEACGLCAALIERGVIPDFRTPDVIRYGLSPLTTRFVDVLDGVSALAGLLGGQAAR
jgi:kynureninase